MKHLEQNTRLRNVAIIAHVDHGKTTLLDAMLRQSGLFREGQAVRERMMDTMDLERERGITIAAKNCALSWKGVKINFLDTPGHADFGGEVERALSMVDGALLLVDASEGPLPQTRFVLSKALAAGLEIIVIINKVDRPDARPVRVLEEIYDLFIDLDASEDQLDFPLLYAVGKAGLAGRSPDTMEENIHPILDEILTEVPAPSHDPSAPFRMLVSDLGYSDYLGRLAVGKVHSGRAHSDDQLICLGAGETMRPLRVTRMQVYEGLGIREAEATEPGDIVVLSGIDEVTIGDTICTREAPKALKRISIEEPTVAMRFFRNTSPLSGREGRFLQSSKIRERLFKETLRNVAIRVEEAEDRESFLVKGRGEFQMAILVETMRREGFELTVGRPEVIFRHQDGKKHEPMEHLFVDCEESFIGVVTEKLSIRKGRMTNLVNHSSGRVRAEFSIPSRGLIGYRDEFLTDTRGTGIMNAYFAGYEEYRGEFPSRRTGSLVADRQGGAVAYALFNLEPRGSLFVVPGDPVYEGMIVGEHNRENDLDVNPCKMKKLSNMRAAGKDENVVLTPARVHSLESAIQFIRADEAVEITPSSIRLRKALLSSQTRELTRRRG